MNIILLSGGSGKRLWPLSNDVRSKQFIKLLDNNDKHESMLQRVYRQILTIDPEAKITIATSSTQVAITRNQLGENVSICEEPCRRDTFPAIALATAYLHEKMNVAEDEAVIICPVDPYVDETYFDGLFRLFKLANNTKRAEGIFLMGIEPNCPSEKYGYIIPETDDIVSKVRQFKEKPSKEMAQEYIGQNALWNSGVFCFKLGYVLSIAKELLGQSSYRGLLDKYDRLPKISFDYAVVEKEQNIKVLRYNGAWKDVGTWNSMVQVLRSRTIGNAILDDNSKNSFIINELNTPILCTGCNDIVIVASYDGILVSNIECSENIKSNVEKLDSIPKIVEESWGNKTTIDIEQDASLKRIIVDRGKEIRDYKTNAYEEIWIVIHGEGKLTENCQSRDIKDGDIIRISSTVAISMFAKSELMILAVIKHI